MLILYFWAKRELLLFTLIQFLLSDVAKGPSGEDDCHFCDCGWGFESSENSHLFCFNHCEKRGMINLSWLNRREVSSGKAPGLKGVASLLAKRHIYSCCLVNMLHFRIRCVHQVETNKSTWTRDNDKTRNKKDEIFFSFQPGNTSVVKLFCHTPITNALCWGHSLNSYCHGGLTSAHI